jgi:hypothetical protein
MRWQGQGKEPMHRVLLQEASCGIFAGASGGKRLCLGRGMAWFQASLREKGMAAARKRWRKGNADGGDGVAILSSMSFAGAFGLSSAWMLHWLARRQHKPVCLGEGRGKHGLNCPKPGSLCAKQQGKCQ